MNSPSLARSILAFAPFVTPITGCAITPIPPGGAQRTKEAKMLERELNPILREGDILLRQGHAPVLGGLLDFSRIVENLTHSQYTHGGIVLQRVGGEVLIVDCIEVGVRRSFLIDWIHEGPEPLLVMRLKDEHAEAVDAVLLQAREFVAEDAPFDLSLSSGTEALYCTELVDECFRSAGLALADKVVVRSLPGLQSLCSRTLYCLPSLWMGLDWDERVAVIGNEDYGLLSSDLLVEVWRYPKKNMVDSTLESPPRR